MSSISQARQVTQPIKSVLIANRGAIACRIIRTLKKLQIRSVAIYSPADKDSLHVQLADQAIQLPGNSATASYLNQSAILSAAQQAAVDAIHPGYGFLSENVDFARHCQEKGFIFIGPSPEQIEAFGLKHKARALATASQVPLVPGTDLLLDLTDAQQAAHDIGYPIMLKSTAGGGGIGMQVCHDEDELNQAFAQVKRLSKNNFSHDGVFLEKFIRNARHIEVQLMGDGQGTVVTLGERECSLQRRNQKVIEETPAPHLGDASRRAIQQAAQSLGESVSYRSAGTVEFILDADSEDFYFLEVNSRLQVEHGVTEMVSGVDLVEWMVRIAQGDAEFLKSYQFNGQGHAIQARIYAEDPGQGFQPSSGLLTQVSWPKTDTNTRIDTWVEAGIEVPPFYDPMLAKLICHADTRAGALQQLQSCLAASQLYGINTNLDYLQQVLTTEPAQSGRMTTQFLNRFTPKLQRIEVLQPGTQTSVQDYPGRIGYWQVGIPPSGPMDSLALRIGNQLLGNPESAAGLEMTLSGPRLKFRCACQIMLTGAPMPATLADQPIEFWQAVNVQADEILELGKTITGMRSYLCIKDGIQLPDYLGSQSTFTLGKLGGFAGRSLQVGDSLPIVQNQNVDLDSPTTPVLKNTFQYPRDWHINVLYGPHGAPDFFTNQDIQNLLSHAWEVHFNSSRTGVRLLGPKPQWARSDGGEAGLHPSNIHDNAYAIGAVDFTGDMPVILGPDGPSLGGFVCPVTLAKADLWKLGQLKPGDKVYFNLLSYAAAQQLDQQVESWLSALNPSNQIPAFPSQLTSQTTASRPKEPIEPAIIKQSAATESRPEICYRVAGDDNILIEYGPQVLDLELRFRVHALMTGLQQHIDKTSITGIIDLTPGIRSLQVHFDPSQLPRTKLLDLLADAEDQLIDIDAMELPTRIVHLPLSWDDPATQLAIDKYQTTVRPDAPWCPSNIEFIRRINGLENIDQVKQILFNASYLVLGLGDVYLGAPVATPLDPRHRLVTTKYNPARTWTPENAVGIGGAYLCVYGMEGPGGYQFVGRTVQMWNRFRSTQAFSQPWLLRFFDQIRFYPVSEEELLDIRQRFPLGQFDLKIEPSHFKLSDYKKFLQQNESSIQAFKQQQQRAFEAERQRWIDSGLDKFEEDTPSNTNKLDSQALQAGQLAAQSPVPGSVWQIHKKPGEQVEAGEPLAIIESMKMEFPVAASESGKIAEVLVKQGQQVRAGQALVLINKEKD